MQRAIMEGDPVTGVTLMQMDEGLDTGGMLAVDKISLSSTTTLQSLHDDLCLLSSKLLIKKLPLILQGELAAVTQPSEGVTLAPKIAKAESKIDWRQTALFIDRQIRAMTPIPGAYTTFNGKRIKLFASQLSREKAFGTPGTVVTAGETLVIATGTGTVEIREVQLEGKPRVTVPAFLRGHKVSQGSMFGL